jgi:phosphomannomutase
VSDLAKDGCDLVAGAVAWRDEDPDPATRDEVDRLLAAQDLVGLRERFGARLQFGTAGLRGPLGAGPNRMNRALVRRATAGVAAWLHGAGAVGPVVVGRDARHGSAGFAADAAAVLAGAGWPVRVLPEPLPTPVLAFAVRHLEAAAGIMVTASHNPAADNGYKLYLGDGAQIVPPIDEEISAAIDAVGPLAGVALSEAGVVEVGPELLDAYVAEVVGRLQRGGPRQVRLVHTSMHGVGGATARAALAAAGFPAPVEVAAQAEPDPDFPTVAFPNPEEPGAMDLALEQARTAGADLVLANDPDADRLALAAPMGASGAWRSLTGDEVGALLADHLLRTRPHDPSDVVATTVVSSRLLSSLAAEAGVAYAETLTGFKWVVRAPGPGQRLLFGYEEALGYSVGGEVRDKDGISAALVAAELVAGLRAEGSNLQDRLDDLHRRHGVHATRQRSRRIPGADWLTRVAAAMDHLRATPPIELAGRAVTATEDLLAGERLPPSDVLIWTVDGGRVVLRPSGTEPKVKCYAEAIVPAGSDLDAARADAEQLVGALQDAMASTLAALGLGGGPAG